MFPGNHRKCSNSQHKWTICELIFTKLTTTQSGTLAFGVGNIAVGQVIGADASGTSVSSLTQTTEGYNDYDVAVTTITNNKFLIYPREGTLETNRESPSRNTNWQVELQHTFTLDFSNANNARS